MSALLACTVVTGIGRLALVCIELLLDHSLRPRLLASRLMLRLELDFAELTDSDDRNILDSLYDPKLRLGMATVSHSCWHEAKEASSV